MFLLLSVIEGVLLVPGSILNCGKMMALFKTSRGSQKWVLFKGNCSLSACWRHFNKGKALILHTVILFYLILIVQ